MSTNLSGSIAPSGRAELTEWVRYHSQLSAEQQAALLAHVDAALRRQEQLWERSKEDAIRALSRGYARRIRRLREQLALKEASVSSIGAYFEALVADLAERANRDPKTRLIHGERFLDQLESFLKLERGRWCAVGLVDVRDFKTCNDCYGHAVGDRVLQTVARLLAEQVRAEDVVTQGGSPLERELHARFGGDEFCFLIPHIDAPASAWAIANRFRCAVASHDWRAIDPRFTAPVAVDVGVVCLELCDVAERRANARTLAQALIAEADRLMYQAKHGCCPNPAHAVVRSQGAALLPRRNAT